MNDDTPTPTHPRAKPDLRARARELRALGHTYNEIATELGVSKSSCSLWLRDMPRPAIGEEQTRRATAARAAGHRRRRARTDDRRLATKRQAARDIGDLTDRDLLLAGAILYWCEGAKRDGRVDFCNSDPAMIGLFLRFLDTAGVTRDRLRFQLQIHEGADLDEAETFWRTLTGADRSRFGKPTIKKSRADSNRRNTGPDYRGCLSVYVCDARTLRWRIEGLVHAMLGTRHPPLGGLPPDIPMTELRRRAVELRRGGGCRAVVGERLGIDDPLLVDALIGDEPPSPDWRRRATAEQINEDTARGLHARGWGCRRISEHLRVPRPTVARWIGATGTAADGTGADGERRIAGIQRHWDRKRVLEEIERRLVGEEAMASVGGLDGRELRFLGALAYWCEGGKDKPYRRKERVQFINGDPGLVRFFLRFVEAAGVERSRLGFRVHIHESGDPAAARRFWSGSIGWDADLAFGKDTIKRHAPRTTYPESQPGYRGCLEIYVAQGADLYRRIEGWALGPALGEAAQERWRR
ncbi:hypothetical protein GCM10009678_36690 [Actinomadura kijaniata]|uniref:Uncharacterized protein n=1 Tax=Actinomadura namibiensis TaxID=182080 RepID=A0A7W3LZQ7_ACTNM|nr:hypothetical protein [Actinomadura namibiensis]MBA8957165.1 hypothetical protein [Actinomadura namibiensis]